MKYVLPPNTETMIVSRINISPFSLYSMNLIGKAVDQFGTLPGEPDAVQDYLGRDYIFTESGRHAIDLILEEEKLARQDVITIFTSLGTNYVSSCVTKTIEKYCKWSMKIERTTKMLFIIHEWGIPHPDIKKLCDLGYPVIEDCAYAFASSSESGRVGNFGTFAVYSLPKFFEIDFGGIVCGLASRKRVINERYESYLKAVVGSQLASLQENVSLRIRNWIKLKHLFSSVGAPPFFPLNEGVIPSVFMFVPHKNLALELIKKRYQKYNVESSIYYGENAFYIPCNQALTEGTLHYLFNIYKGMLEVD